MSRHVLSDGPVVAVVRVFVYACATAINTDEHASAEVRHDERR